MSGHSAEKDAGRKDWISDREYVIHDELPAQTDVKAAVLDILAAHDERAQNVEGDWICACGSFLCPPDDERLNRCHREHIATIISRRVFPPEVGAP